MSITLDELAREVGVNPSTVSRALSGSYGVHAETRQKVLETAKRLGYSPNRAARALATGKTHTLGLIVSDIRNPYFAELARGAEDAAHKVGCDLVLCNSDLDPVKQRRYIKTLLEKRVDGIVMNAVGRLEPAFREELVNGQAPVVLLNRSAKDSNLSSVATDTDAGGAAAAGHLLSLGHRHIAHLMGPAGPSPVTIGRSAAFVRACEAAGVRPIVLHGKNSAEGAIGMTRQLLTEHPQVTAIFAANDAMAFGVLRTLSEMKLKVPEDISLVGFDNLELSAVLSPGLTTVHQPKYEIGQTAVETLLRLAALPVGSRAAEHHVFMPHLVLRQSTAAPSLAPRRSL